MYCTFIAMFDAVLFKLGFSSETIMSMSTGQTSLLNIFQVYRIYTPVGFIILQFLCCITN